MCLTPKDMDFIEAKHVAAREIALALGVPPMLLGIPGDNTYSNYQEATRTFWRHTVLPLVTRTAKALSTWLSPAYGGCRSTCAPTSTPSRPSPPSAKPCGRASTRPPSSPRTKSAPRRYAPAEGSDPAGLTPGSKYSPNQPRVPAGQPSAGQWTNGGGDGGEGTGGGELPPSAVVSEPIQLAQVGGAADMTDTGLRSATHLGATLMAPDGQTLQTFEVSPLTNNNYRIGNGLVDVTGWTAILWSTRDRA